MTGETERVPLTERDVLDALYVEYQHMKMSAAVVRHVPLGLSTAQPGFYEPDQKGTIRYIDALVVRKDRLWAVEVKTSRADLRRELANPDKSLLWREHTHAFYFAVPPDLLEFALAEIPPGWGVLCPWRLPGAGAPTLRRRAHSNKTPEPLPLELWLRLSMRLGRYQHGDR